jgi:hypothetical protein
MPKHFRNGKTRTSNNRLYYNQRKIDSEINRDLADPVLGRMETYQ